jgi:anti-anti-sigma regulatory factor
VRVADRSVVVAVTGEVDQRGAVRLRAELLDLLPVCAGVLTVDLTACAHLGEDGAQVLLQARRQAERGPSRCRIMVEAVRPEVRHALDAAAPRRGRPVGARVTAHRLG